MKVLVTGASGFVGKHLVKALIQQNMHIIGIGRKVIKSEADEFFSVPDFTNSKAWQKPLEGCDVVIHLAARVHVINDGVVNPLVEFRKANTEATLVLAEQAAQAGVTRFIYISSIKVNGDFTQLGKPFTEDNLPNPQDAYGLTKYEAEQVLLAVSVQTNMEVVIIRSPLVYGDGVKANFASLIMALKKGVPLPFGAINNKRSFVFVGNLVSLILRCIEHPKAANQLFLVSDGHDLSTTELLRACVNALGIKACLFPLPQKLIKAVASILGKRDATQRLCGNLQVDISKAHHLLDWEPPISVKDGLKATVLER